MDVFNKSHNMYSKNYASGLSIFELSIFTSLL